MQFWYVYYFSSVMQKHLYSFIVSIFIADIFLFLSWIPISLLWNIPQFISDFYNIFCCFFAFFVSQEFIFIVQEVRAIKIYIYFRLQCCCLIIFCILCHSACRFALADAATCAATLRCGLPGSHGRLPFRARRAAPCPSHLSYIFVSLIIQLFISRRLLPPFFFILGAFMKPFFFFFAAAERPQGVRRFLSSAGSGAQPPRFYFWKFLFFSSFFLFFFPLFPLFFSCCAYILPPAGGN